MIGEAFPRLSDSCGICFCVENTGFLVSGSLACKIKKHSKVSVSSLQFYAAKWEGHGNCFVIDCDLYLIQKYCNIFRLFIACMHSYCCLRMVKWLGYHYSYKLNSWLELSEKTIALFQSSTVCYLPTHTAV